MKVLIIVNYSTLEGEKGSGRFPYLADLFVENGHQVTLICSSFSHRKKKHRDVTELKGIINGKYDIEFIDEPGYKNHFGLARMRSIRRFRKNLSKRLSNIKELPDVIYFSIPTLSSASCVTKFAIDNKIPAVVDIIDIWPEALSSVFHFPKYLFQILFIPFIVKANSIYKKVNAIVGVSETYVLRAKKVNNTAKSNAVYIGTDLTFFDSCLFSKTKGDNEIWLTYVGTLSYSYDILTILKAAKILKARQNFKNIRFKIIGTGPQKDKLKHYAKVLELPVEFIDFLPYNDMVNYLKNSDIALNAIVKGAQQSITYKIGDYVSAGLPILNSSENIEFRKMVVEKKLGLNYEPGNENSMVKQIITLVKDRELKLAYGRNSRDIAEQKFDRRKTYPGIIVLVENTVKDFTPN